MLVIGKFSPREQEFELKDAQAVSIRPYKHRFIVGGVIVTIVILSYIIFS